VLSDDYFSGNDPALQAVGRLRLMIWPVMMDWLGTVDARVIEIGSCLKSEHLGITSIVGHELIVGSRLDNLAFVEHIDAVGRPD